MPRKNENIYLRSDGRWEGRYIKSCDKDGKNVFAYIYGKSYNAVKEKLFIQMNSFDFLQEQTPNKTALLFGFICDEWLEMNRIHWKESTYSKYYHVINDYIKPTVGSLQVSQISSQIIQNEVNKLITKKLSVTTVRDYVNITNSILKYSSQKQYYCTKKVSIIYPKSTKKEITVFSRHEQRQFERILQKNIDLKKLGIYFALYTGVRCGELSALTWGDIDLKSGIISITKTMQRIQDRDSSSKSRTKIYIMSPKSKQSVRKIPIPETLSEKLRNFYCEDKSAYLLTGTSDRFVEPRSLQNIFKRLTDEANITKINFHALRHTFATRCVEVGFDIKSLSEILGHSSVKITLDLYVHSSFEQKVDNMKKLNSIAF